MTEHEVEEDITVEELVAQVIGETAGYVSLCWDPKPTGVFDSTLASAAVDKAVQRILSLLAEAEARPPIERQQRK